MKKLIKKVCANTTVSFKFQCRCYCSQYNTDHYSEYLRVYRIENNEPLPQ